MNTTAPPDTTGGAYLSDSSLTSNDAVPLTPNVAQHVGAHGEGDTEEAALEDLREALIGLIEEFGVPRELSVTVAA